MGAGDGFEPPIPDYETGVLNLYTTPQYIPNIDLHLSAAVYQALVDNALTPVQILYPVVLTPETFYHLFQLLHPYPE